MDEMTCLRCDSPLGYVGRFDALDVFECPDCAAGYEVSDSNVLAFAA
jgi:hypothetical protein